MRHHLRIGSRLSWIAALALAAGAPVVHLLALDAGPWWVAWIAAPCLAAPLLLLIEWRRERKGYEDAPAGGDGGTWAGTGDHGALP